MSKKVSAEARVMDFFETADELVAKTVFNLVVAAMKRRFPVKSADPKPRKPRSKKNTTDVAVDALATPSKSTSFDHGANAPTPSAA